MTYMIIYNLNLSYFQKKLVPVLNQINIIIIIILEQIFLYFYSFFKSPIFFFLSWQLQAMIPVSMIMFGGWIL